MFLNDERFYALLMRTYGRHSILIMETRLIARIIMIDCEPVLNNNGILCVGSINNMWDNCDELDAHGRTKDM